MNGARRIESILFIAAVALLTCSVLVIGAVSAVFHPLFAKPELAVPEEAAPSKSTWFIARSFENAFERVRVAVTDFSRVNVPGYDRMQEANTQSNLAMNRALFDWTFGDGYTFLPITKIPEGNVFVHKAGGHMLLGEPDTVKDPFGGTALINGAQARHPELNMYVYLVPALGATHAITETDPLLDFGAVPMADALEQLSPGIAHDILDMPDYETYTRYFYATDHHWTLEGSHLGYLDVVAMLRTKYPDIRPRALNAALARTATDVRGSLATVGAYDGSSDTVTDGGYELPPHELVITAHSGKEFAFASVDATRPEVFPDRKYWDGYGGFFTPTQVRARFEYPENRTGRKLMLMGDSLRKCIMEPIASHFDETYTIDVRYDAAFRFDDFVREHGITDVLFLYGDTYNNISASYQDKF